MVPPPTAAPSSNALSAQDLSASALRGMGVGGMDEQLEDLFRRAFASRLVPSSVAAQMGMGHVKGVLLYGPPGTGKTLVARKIAKLLANNREPEIVNGPELLTRWVGQSEANIRSLFERAEKQYHAQGDNAELHVIIFDEIDALCKARGSGGGEGSGHAGVGESVVNQLLTKMDGLDSAPNVLIIGMTNRRDLLDEALLRPGRFEVQMEVGLPDAAGRRQILEIHTRTMAENGMLAADVDLYQLAESSRNFSGAELAGLVRSATSRAYQRLINSTHSGEGHGSEEGVEPGSAKGSGVPVQVHHRDFLLSLKEVIPRLGGGGLAFGSAAVKRWVPYGIIRTGAHMDSLMEACRGLVAQVQRGTDQDPMLTALLEGPSGAGKTALAATVALESGFPFARIICPADSMVGMSSSERAQAVKKAFEDARASPLSVLVLDNLERILGFSPVGPVYSNEVLQTLLLLLRRQPVEGRRLLVLATTSCLESMEALGVSPTFDVSLHVAPLTTTEEKAAVLQAVTGLSAENSSSATRLLPEAVPIKRLLRALKIAAAAEASADGGGEVGMAGGVPMAVTLEGLEAHLKSLQKVATNQGRLQMGVGYSRMNKSVYM